MCLLFLFLCFLTIVWAAVPLLSLSVFLALFHQPVVHRPIFHPASPPLCVLSALHFFAFYFPCSCILVSHLPVWQLHPPSLFFLQTDHVVSRCSDIAGVNQSGLGGLTGWIVYCRPSLSWLTTWDCQSQSRANDTGQRRKEGHKDRVPSCLSKPLMGLLQAPGNASFPAVTTWYSEDAESTDYKNDHQFRSKSGTMRKKGDSWGCCHYFADGDHIMAERSDGSDCHSLFLQLLFFCPYFFGGSRNNLWTQS